jgi:predicted nucleic acid-binding protein
VLLDTDVFSYLLGDKGALAERYRPHVRNRTVAVSFITVGEVYSGLFSISHAPHHKQLDAILTKCKIVK